MTLIILLFALGILLIGVEVIVPGGILGSIGAVMLFIGCWLAFREYGNGGGFVALAVAILLAALTIYLEFRILPKTKIGKRAFLSSEITGVSAPSARKPADSSANPPRPSPCFHPPAISASMASATKPSANPARFPPARRSK